MEDLGVDGSIFIWTLKYIFGACGLDSRGSGHRLAVGSCEITHRI
jgi:hypothetical protein